MYLPGEEGSYLPGIPTVSAFLLEGAEKERATDASGGLIRAVAERQYVRKRGVVEHR